MVTRNENGMVRVTVTLEPGDVDLLDELARMERSNRSAELRGLLRQVRPVMTGVVETFRGLEAQREKLDVALINASVSELEAIRPDAEALEKQFLGMMAKLEGAAAAGAADAPASNTGATD